MTSRYIPGVGLVRRRVHVDCLAPLPLDAAAAEAAAALRGDSAIVGARGSNDGEELHACDAGAQTWGASIEQAVPREPLEMMKKNVQSLSRHARICERMFQSERMLYDMTEHRRDQLPTTITVSEQAVGHPPAATGVLSCGPASLGDSTLVEAHVSNDVAELHACDAGALPWGANIEQEGTWEQWEASENVQLFPCSLCGRTFREERLEKHVNICERVFQSKRKKLYDMTEHRRDQLPTTITVSEQAVGHPPAVPLVFSCGPASLSDSTHVEARVGNDVVELHACDAGALTWGANIEREGTWALLETGENVQLLPCSLCGRTFREERLEKHVYICERVFLSRRKVYDMVPRRLSDLPVRVWREVSMGEMQKNVAKPQTRWRQKSLAIRTAFQDVQVNRYRKGAMGRQDIHARAQQCADGLKNKYEAEKELRNHWRLKMNADRVAMKDARLVETCSKESMDHQDVHAGTTGLADRVREYVAKATAIQLFPCSHCGRTFRKAWLETHARICQHVFQSKRDVYVDHDLLLKLSGVTWGLGVNREVEKMPQNDGRQKLEYARAALQDALVAKDEREKSRLEAGEHQEGILRNSTKRKGWCFCTPARRRGLLNHACLLDPWDSDPVPGHDEQVERDIIRDDRCLPSWSPARALSAQQRERRVRFLDVRFGSNFRPDFPQDILPPEGQVQIQLRYERWHRDLASARDNGFVWRVLETEIVRYDRCLPSWSPARVLSPWQRERRIRCLDARFSSNLQLNFLEDSLPPTTELQIQLCHERRHRDLAREAVDRVVWRVLGAQLVAWPGDGHWPPEAPVDRERWARLAQRSRDRSRRPVSARARRRTRETNREILRAMATATTLRGLGASAASHLRSHNLGFGRSVANIILDFLAPAFGNDSRQRLFEIMDTDQDGVVDCCDFSILLQEPMVQWLALSAAFVHKEISDPLCRDIRMANVYGSLEAWGSRVHAHLRAARPYLDDAATSSPNLV